MEPPADRADTIASAAESQRPVDRTRALLIVATVLLAAATTVATFVATNFHRQVTQLRAHPPAVATLPVVPSPVQLSTSAAATTAVSSSPATVSPVVSATPPSAPPLTLRAVDLDMPRPHVTVYLAAAAAEGVGFTDGQLVVTALVRGGQPGARYRLTGGACDGGQQPPNVDQVWAQGVADATGTAFLTGPDWTLPKVDQYFLVLETLAPGATTSVTGSGLEGVFLLSGPLSPNHAGRSPCL